MVMQELSLVPTLTVAENLFLGRLPQRAGWLNRSALRSAAQAQLAKIGLTSINPDAPISTLGIGQQQMVEIARNLHDDTRILVLDEPTAMLTPREINYLFQQISILTQRDVAIVYVSHRLEELRRIANRVAVLRDGELVDVLPMKGLTEEILVQRMVGRSVEDLEHRPRRTAGPTVLSINDLGRASVVNNISLNLHAGEVFGIAGLVGSGRTEFLRILYGADRADRGSISVSIDNEKIEYTKIIHTIAKGFSSPFKAIGAGVGLVTEDRKSLSLLLTQSIRVNCTLSNLKNVSSFGWLRPQFESKLVRRFIERLRIRCSGSEQIVSQLSGGNQQKVVFTRWLHRPCKVLLLDEPTRGVDVGARAEIYTELNRMAAEGRALVMVSSDLRELMAMSDRIGVMNAGRIVKIFERGEWSEQMLLSAAFSEMANIDSQAQ